MGLVFGAGSDQFDSRRRVVSKTLPRLAGPSKACMILWTKLVHHHPQNILGNPMRSGRLHLTHGIFIAILHCRSSNSLRVLILKLGESKALFM